MDPYLFRERAARFERLNRRTRLLYRVLLVLLVALGYAYLLMVLGSIAILMLLMLLLVVGTRNVFAAWRLLGSVADFSGRVARALWVRIDPPPGVPVTRAQAPALFAAVDDVRRALRTHRVHTVLVTDEPNASMAQVPRLGILGWQRNYLSLGLPLLRALSPEHAGAVVAHELAHLSRRHSRMGVWIYRVMESWRRLGSRVEVGGRPSGVLGAFFRWYVPFLDAFTQVERRENELEADALAARVVGARTMAAALARAEIVGRHHGEVFCPWFSARAAARPQPPHGPLTALWTAPERNGGLAWIHESLTEPESPFSSHPKLLTRMEALGLQELAEEDLAPPAASAAGAWLGELQDVLADQLDRAWVETAREGWLERHRTIQSEWERLAELEGAAEAGRLELEERLEHAWLVEEHRGFQEAAGLYAALAVEAPGNAAVRCHAGRALLCGGDEAGLAHLHAAIEMDRNLVGVAAKAAFPFLVAHGRREEAREWYIRELEQEMENAAAQEERRYLAPREPMAPPEASPDEVEQLRALLETFPNVRAACLVRRALRYRPDVPCHLLLLDTGRARDQAMSAAVQEIARRMPIAGEVWVHAPRRRRIRQAKRVAGALVYRWDRSRGSVPRAELAVAGW